jgi:hypothetical protein
VVYFNIVDETKNVVISFIEIDVEIYYFLVFDVRELNGLLLFDRRLNFDGNSTNVGASVNGIEVRKHFI